MRQRNFLWLWGSQFVSGIGSQLSLFALPSIAIFMLHATATQIGALQSTEFGVISSLAIFAGVIVDRCRRRPIMIVANLVRLAAIAALPIAFFTHHLSLTLFFVVAVIASAATVTFDAAFAALLPGVTGRKHFGDALSKMAMTSSTAEAIGTGASGTIVQFLGAPFAVAMNVATYAAATVALLRIHEAEPTESMPAAAPSFLRELGEGLSLVWNNRLLRSLALTTSTAYLGGSMVTAIFTLYAYRVLQLSPFTFGLLMGCANIGLVGAWYAKRLADQLGSRTALAGVSVVAGLAKMLFLFTPGGSAVFSLFFGRLLLTLTGPIYETIAQELRITGIAQTQLGRMNATMRTVIWSALPVGAALGGICADSIGIERTIFLGALISMSSAGWLLLCPPRVAPPIAGAFDAI